jgi:small subunit ribosomal protein S19
MVKKFKFRGYTLEELKKMSISEFAKLLKSKSKRTLNRGLTEPQKKLLEKIRKSPEKFHKTHCRDMIILPEMVGTKIGVYSGRKFVPVEIKPEMLGFRLGDFVSPIQRVKHSAPGIGASRGTKGYSLARPVQNSTRPQRVASDYLYFYTIEFGIEVPLAL